MTSPNDPAYPKLPLNQGDQGISYPGLTKREMFAALAMQGLRASGQLIDPKMTIHELAVYDADALIAELNKHE